MAQTTNIQLSKANEHQLEAIQITEGPVLIIAGPGSGKTFTLVERIVYQDTNTIQERILLLLAGERSNHSVVGDNDQGLYRLRGATIRNILEFPGLFRDGQCKQVKLTVNYRSHPDIIRFYKEWMKGLSWEDDQRQYRFAKQILPRQDIFPEVPATLRLATSAEDGELHISWHQEVLTFLHGLKATGQLSDWNQVAFFFRSVKNNKVVALARFPESQGGPVFSPGSNMFFDLKEIRLMIGTRNRLIQHHHIIETGKKSYCFRHSSKKIRRRIRPENIPKNRYANAPQRRNQESVLTFERRIDAN